MANAVLSTENVTALRELSPDVARALDAELVQDTSPTAARLSAVEEEDAAGGAIQMQALSPNALGPEPEPELDAEELAKQAQEARAAGIREKFAKRAAMADAVNSPRSPGNEPEPEPELVRARPSLSPLPFPPALCSDRA